MGIQKGMNPNRPQKGDRLTVSPITQLKDIKLIKKLLADKPRDLALFTLGINTNLRASDILALKVKDVKYLKPGDVLVINERKTKKRRLTTINKQVVDVIANLLKSREYQDDEYLFIGKRGTLTVPTLTNMVKAWCKAINLNGGNYGSHTLRKTWGYHQRVTFGVGLPELMVAFNHSSQKQTLDYLCVQEAEVRNCFLNEL